MRRSITKINSRSCHTTIKFIYTGFALLRVTRVHVRTENERMLSLITIRPTTVQLQPHPEDESAWRGTEEQRAAATLNYLSRNYSFMLIRFDTPADLELLPA